LPLAAAVMAEPVALSDKTFDNVREVSAKTHMAASSFNTLSRPRLKQNAKCDLLLLCYIYMQKNLGVQPSKHADINIAPGQRR
jgi:hypothetical protein